MTQLSKNNFKTLYGTNGSLFPDNSTGDISEADLRSFGEDVADSFKIYDQNEAPPVLKAEITLSAAQIKALGTTPVTLIAAQGAGTIISFEGGYYSHEYGSAAFDFPSQGLYVQVNSVPVNGGNDVTAWLNATGDRINFFGKIEAEHGTGSINASLTLRMGTPNTDATTGDSTATVVIYYRVITI